MKNSKIYPWIVVGLLWGVALLNYMDRQMLSTMKEAMQMDITELQSATNFGRLMAIFLWIYALMSPVSGVIADRLNRKWLIVGSLFVWSSVTYLMGVADTFNQIVWLRALMGVSEALYIPAGLSLIADYHTGKSRSLAVGIHMTGLYTGQAIGGFGATVAAAVSWHTTFHWFGIIGIVYAVILMLFLHDKKTESIPTEKLQAPPHKEKESVFTSLKSLLTNVAFWVILLYLPLQAFPDGLPKLAPDLVCRKPESTNVTGWPYLYHYDCRIFLHRCHHRRSVIRLVGTKELARTRIYRSHRFGTDHSFLAFIRLWT